MSELEREPVISLREKLKKKQGRNLSIRSKYDFIILLYFIISDCSIMFPDDFWVYLLIGVDVCFLCAFSVRASCSNLCFSVENT